MIGLELARAGSEFVGHDFASNVDSCGVRPSAAANCELFAGHRNFQFACGRFRIRLKPAFVLFRGLQSQLPRAPEPLFRLFRSVAAAGLFTVGDAQGIEHAADDLVANTGQVADTAAADEHDRVFLQVVALTRDIRGDFLTVGEPYTGHLPQSRVRLLRRDGLDEQANPPLLRTAFQHGGFGLAVLERRGFRIS